MNQLFAKRDLLETLRKFDADGFFDGKEFPKFQTQLVHLHWSV
jgi:hypothetical protein